MTKAATFKATFHTARPAPSRGVVTFSFDVPTEHATAALEALGGFPSGGDAVWVAIARLTDEAAHKPDARERYTRASEGDQAVTRAALLCNDKDFQHWLLPQATLESVSYKEIPSAMTRQRLCLSLGIDSRAELATNPEALQRFLDLEARFKTEKIYGPQATR